MFESIPPSLYFSEGFDRLAAAAAAGQLDPLWLAELQRRYVTSGGPPPPPGHIPGVYPPPQSNVAADLIQRERERIDRGTDFHVSFIFIHVVCLSSYVKRAILGTSSYVLDASFTVTDDGSAFGNADCRLTGKTFQGNVLHGVLINLQHSCVFRLQLFAVK
jgi:hypothetical protein